MIRGGTTMFVDMNYYPDVIVEVVDSCGLRAMVSATVIDQRDDAQGRAAIWALGDFTMHQCTARGACRM